MSSYRLNTRIDSSGYPVLRGSERDYNRSIYEHVLIAEKAMGNEMPKGAEVHHVNEDRTDNRNKNLVVCGSPEYHQLLHTRMRAKKACGNPNWRLCKYCSEHDAPENVTISGKTVYHKKCHTNYNKKLREKWDGSDIQ